MCEEKKNILESLSGMFEHYDVYQTLIEFDLSRDSILRGADLNDRNLKLFGFVLDRVDDSLKRYNRVYRFPGVTNYIIHSDGTWSHVVEVSIKQKQHHVYSLADLAKIWEELTGININVSQYAHISKFDQMYDQLREAINKFNEDLVSQDEHVREMASTFGNPFGRFFHSDIRFSTYFMGWRYFEELYKNSIIEGKLKKEIADMLHLRSAMFSCNRFFFPAMNGEQFGNPKASKVLLEKSLEIVNEEIKEMEENE
jgi:hypothetical protein